jgi:hypothetical protein
MDSDTEAVRDLLSEIDPELIALTLRLTTGQRILRWLHARELAIGLRRGQLRERYPDLSWEEVNLKVESFDE